MEGNIIGPCENCQKNKEFSFDGCARSCKIFLEHLKKVFAKGSPCKDFHCTVPGVNKKHRKRCMGCPLPAIYSDSFGENLIKSSLGVREKDITRYVYPYDGKYPWEGRCK
jgi:hypothetical protein